MIGFEVGEQAMLGRVTAQRLECPENAGGNITLVAEGVDWLVFRDNNGRARAIAFNSSADKVTFMRGVNK